MDSNRFNKLFWKHYLILEEDFKYTQRYVELSTDNFSTFSVEYIKLLQGIGSEFDVICKEICRYYGHNDKNCISDYASIIIPQFTNLQRENIIIKYDNSITVNPLGDWIIEPIHRSPEWWRAYNNIKHDRANSFKQANLKNVLMGLASLYLIEMYFIYEIAEEENSVLKIPEISSLLFEIKDWKAKQRIYGDGLLFNESE